MTLKSTQELFRSTSVTHSISDKQWLVIFFLILPEWNHLTSVCVAAQPSPRAPMSPTATLLFSYWWVVGVLSTNCFLSYLSEVIRQPNKPQGTMCIYTWVDVNCICLCKLLIGFAHGPEEDILDILNQYCGVLSLLKDWEQFGTCVKKGEKLLSARRRQKKLKIYKNNKWNPGVSKQVHFSPLDSDVTYLLSVKMINGDYIDKNSVWDGVVVVPP